MDERRKEILLLQKLHLLLIPLPTRKQPPRDKTERSPCVGRSQHCAIAHVDSLAFFNSRLGESMRVISRCTGSYERILNSSVGHG